ncbi:transcriptional regulator TenI [Bacillus thuringiensis serovar kurstaki str. HD-1]|nr:transcriptional regulator TenI [Bacillus thuringiensis serovar kurstaki str. HD-1]
MEGFPASKIVINDRIDIAILLNIPRVQLGYRSTDVKSVKEKFSYLHVGYSVHSLDEAIVAFKNGADSLVYGHVFPTDCKKGVPARGLEEISDIARCLYPKDLSGGMRQRVSFIRTLLTGGEILLLDEPFSALDALTKTSLQEWLFEQWQEWEKTILFIIIPFALIFLNGNKLAIW